MSEEEKTKINIMLKDRDIDNILERELSLDRYCYVHNYIASLKIEKDNLLEENKQLKELTDKYEEEHKTTFETWLKEINILTELEEWCKSWKENDKYCYLASNDKDKCRYDIWGEVLDKIQELKEKYK